MSYIVPRKLPTNCCGCHMFKQEEHDLWCIANHYAGYCKILGEYIDENKFTNERHPDCPLIEIKTPHGRLIDADEMIRIWDGATFEGSVKPLIDARLTVIEAEGNE